MPVPELFGRYRAVRRLGVGAFATVWLARDEQLDGSVAVKVLADNWASRGDVRERFLEEARMLRRADSDRVVRVHDIGELEDGRPYFVMTYADRGILADRLTDFPMPAPEALWYAEETALGVAVLHARGIIHRDIKPSNVLLRTADGAGDGYGEQVLVSDLGLAKAAAVASGITLTAGTPGYMAPEQAQGVGLTFASDVYALGALTYRLLAGRLPHQVGSPLSVLSTAADPVPALELTGLPPALDAVLRRALSRDPADRQTDARAFARALAGAAAELVDPAALLDGVDLLDRETLGRGTGDRERPERVPVLSRGSGVGTRPGVRTTGGGRDPDAEATVITRTRPWTADVKGAGDRAGTAGGAGGPDGSGGGASVLEDAPGPPVRRGRAAVLGIGIGVAVVLAGGLVAAVAEPGLVTRGRAVLAGDRVVRQAPFAVTVPASWSQRSAVAGPVPGMGRPADQLTLSGHLARYRSDPAVAGVFLGVVDGHRADAVRSALRYPGCTVAVVRPGTLLAGWTGATASRTCGSATVLTWVATTDARPDRTVLVEVKVPSDQRAVADRVLHSVAVTPAPTG